MNKLKTGFMFDLSFDPPGKKEVELKAGLWTPNAIEDLPPKRKNPVYHDSISQQIKQPQTGAAQTPKAEFILGFTGVKSYNTHENQSDQNTQNHPSKQDNRASLDHIDKPLENINDVNSGQFAPNSLAQDAPAAETDLEEMMFSADELMQTRDEAYSEGYEQGLKEGKDQAELMQQALHDELLERLSSELQAKAKAQHQAHEQMSLYAMRLVQHTMQKFLPTSLKRHGADEILTIFSETLRQLKAVSNIAIAYHPDHDEALRPKLNIMLEKQNITAEVKIFTNSDMAIGDVNIDWGSGGVERHYQDIMQAINEAVALIERNHEPTEPVKPSSTIDDNVEDSNINDNAVEVKKTDID